MSSHPTPAAAASSQPAPAPTAGLASSSSHQQQDVETGGLSTRIPAPASSSSSSSSSFHNSEGPASPPRVTPAPSRAPAIVPVLYQDTGDYDDDHDSGGGGGGYAPQHTHPGRSRTGNAPLAPLSLSSPAAAAAGAKPQPPPRRSSAASSDVSGSMFAAHHGNGGLFSGAAAASVGGLWEGPVGLNGTELRSRSYLDLQAEEALPLVSASSGFASFASLRCRAAFECAASLAESPRLPSADANPWSAQRLIGLVGLIVLSFFGLRLATPDNIHAVVLAMRHHRAAGLALYTLAFTLGVAAMLPGMLFAIGAGAAFGFWSGLLVSFFATVMGARCSGLRLGAAVGGSGLGGRCSNGLECAWWRVQLCTVLQQQQQQQQPFANHPTTRPPNTQLSQQA